MKKLLLLGVSAMLLWSCSPRSEDTTIDQLDLTITVPKDGTDFQQYKTYAIRDSVWVISSDPDTGDSLAKTETDIVILEEINEQMAKLGYTKIELEDTATTNPDLAVDVTRLVNNFSGGGYVPGYCSGGWGYWGYCYPGQVYSYSYDTGTITVSFLDLKNRQTGDEYLDLVWHLYANGYMQDNSLSNNNRLKANISRGFDQSTYLILQ
jgi:hypothetical protein